MLNTEATYFTAVIVAESADEEKRSFLLVGQKYQPMGSKQEFSLLIGNFFPKNG